jgi:hypothetical protein
MTTDTDHLRVWLTLRDTVPWRTARPAHVPDGRRVVPSRDGAVHDIGIHDRARAPQRAAGLLTALALVREDARADVPLTFDRLHSWQCHVLGVSRAPFRHHPAYAKGGRERYGDGPHLRDRFQACLAQSDAPDLPLAALAARLYLDVCFFHPFEDGNARSAFLALTFVLARAGIVLDQVAPIRRIQRRADDPEDALALANLVAILISTTCRRGSWTPTARDR